MVFNSSGRGSSGVTVDIGSWVGEDLVGLSGGVVVILVG